MKNKLFKLCLLIILLILLVIFAIFKINTGKKELYEEVTAKVNDISTYYTFKGNIEVKNKQEVDIKAIEVGKEVFIHINALEKDINGTIGSISKEATETNGVSYFTSEVDVKQDGTLRVGMSTEIKTLNKSATNAVTIPMEVVQFDKENNPFVYFKDSEGNVKRKDIKVGINDGNTVEIIEGISENETVLYPAKISLMDVSFKDLKKE